MSRFSSWMNNAATDLQGLARPFARLFNYGVATGLSVTQHAGGANMSVDVQTGDAMIGSIGNYGVWNWSDAVVNVTIGAASPTSRHDVVVAYVDYSVTNPSTSTPNNPGAFKFIAVQGTPSGTPVDPTSTVIQAAVGSSNPYIILASVLILSTDTNVTTARITNYLPPMSLLTPYLWGGSNSTKGHLVPNIADGTLITTTSNNVLSPAALSELGTWQVNILPYNPNNLVHGTWTFVSNVGDLGGGVFTNVTTGTVNDEIYYAIVLQAGTYTLNLITDLDANMGQIACSLDGLTPFVTFENYRGSGKAQNFTQTWTGIVIPTSGLHTLDFKIGAKNGSSSAYVLAIHLINLVRTA